MVRKFRAIVQSKVEPTDHEVLWYKDGAVLFWSDDEWQSFLKGKYDVIAEEAFNISKSNEIRLTEAESIIDTHEQYLNILDNKRASYINVHAEFPDYFGEPGLISNNIRNVAYILSLQGEKYSMPGLVVTFFAGPDYQTWQYKGGGMTDESNWTKILNFTASDLENTLSPIRQDIADNSAKIQNNSEELKGGDVIVNINKEIGIEDAWFELDSAIANVPARYKYRCGLFITFLWQRPADGEKVWQTYQFKGCDSSGEQEEQWQDTSRWNQMADVRFVVENAMSRCSALEDSQREQDNKITQLQGGKQDKLVSSEDILVDANVLRIADIAKKKVFIDMWNAACEINGKRWGWYDETADDFLIYPDFRNGEGLHLTYEQAVKCYVVSRKTTENYQQNIFRSPSGDDVYALLPIRISAAVSSIRYSFHDMSQVRAIALASNIAIYENMQFSFRGCENLEVIYGVIDYQGTAGGLNSETFYQCTALRELRFFTRKVSFSVSSSPLLSLASFQHMLTRSDNSVAITITVHPDCYAKMTGDTTNAAAAALTEEEAAQWQQLLTDAVAKNITFATA